MSVIVDQPLHAPADEGADHAIRMDGRPWPGFTCLPLMDGELYPVVSPARQGGAPRISPIGIPSACSTIGTTRSAHSSMLRMAFALS